MMKRLLLILTLLASPAFAVQVDELLDDPVLESRAREISAGLRCPVCRNESIDESNAGVSKDLRVLVRDRLLAGDSNDEVVAYIVDRYGEYVLLKPTTDGANQLLWWAGPICLVLGLGVGWMAIRPRKRPAPAALNAEEEARLAELLKDD